MTESETHVGPGPSPEKFEAFEVVTELDDDDFWEGWEDAEAYPHTDREGDEG